jgi:uncharacterized protein (TIGR02284 family)
MENNKIADALNKLVEINNDRVEGYEKAANETDDAALKALFLKFSAQSRSYRAELEGLVRSQGADPIEGTTTSGKFYRAWMDIKAALSGKDRKAIVSSCEFGEDVAKDTYKDVLHDLGNAPEHVRSIIQRHYSEIREAHDQIKAMRDTQVS